MYPAKVSVRECFSIAERSVFDEFLVVWVCFFLSFSSCWNNCWSLVVTVFRV